MIDADRIARELIDLIKSRFVTANGLLARHYPPRARTLFDNFDDLAPFFLYYGEHDFLVEQIHRASQYPQPLVDLCADQGVLLTRNIDEWFGGIYAVWKKTGDATAQRLLEQGLSFVRQNLLAGDFLSAACRADGRRRADCYEGWSAGLLEVFIEMDADHPGLEDAAAAVLSRWTSDEYFERYGLFPYRMFIARPRRFFQRHVGSRLPPASYAPAYVPEPWRVIAALPRRIHSWLASGWYSQLMKSNTTPAFAMLELYRRHGDERWRGRITRWLDAALAAFHVGDHVYMEYFPTTRQRRGAGATPAFILVDVICDVFHFTDGAVDRMETAKAILDATWKQRLPSGLVAFEAGGACAHIDSQVDFSIAYRRYAELSGDPSYATQAEQLMTLALTEHATPEGYRTYSGARPSDVIDPKYNALVLKGLIGLATAGRRIYPDLHDLFKDR